MSAEGELSGSENGMESASSRGMRLLLAVFVFSAHAELDLRSPFDPDVPTSFVEGQVKNLEVGSTGVVVTLIDGQDEKRKLLKPCQQQVSIGALPPTVEESAILLQQRIEILREAERSHRKVRLGMHGPWNECVISISQI